MPGSVDDPGGSAGDGSREWVVPAYTNDVEFARNNRLFCNFIHRGVMPRADGHGRGGREEIVAYL
jgi:hypothetical protein